MKRLFIAVMVILLVTTAFGQIVNKAEYFFDTDPGPGNGSPISINTPGVSVSFPAQIPVNLSPGFHWLGIRVKDSDGKWSLFQRKDFYVSQPDFDLPIITKAEYFFDNDPGVGNGTPLNFQNAGFSVSQTFPITVPVSMTGGTHYLAIRVKDQAGHWSLFQRDTIVVGAASTISCPGNVVVSAPAGQCSAIVNNIDPTTSSQGLAYTYTLSGATTGNGTGTASGKTFNTGVTTVTYALTNSPATTCSFTVTVNSNIVPAVTINANTTSICTGGTIVFTATPTNGGNNPHYQWKQNGVNTGTDSVILQTNQLNNGDVISVVMTSSMGCATPATATSNSITVAVTPPYITPTINITASSTSVCPGTQVTFTAHTTNGGSPWHSWYVNNVWVPRENNSDTFNISTLANGDKVKCVMTSTLACVTDVTTVSNEITMSVGGQPASVSIVASDTSICTGQLVTFTATPVNAGNNTVYEWILNSNAVGTNSPTYQNASLADGDKIKVTMATQTCGGYSQPVSNTITMHVNSSAVASVNVSASAIDICAGQQVNFTATPTNGGNNPSYQWKLNGNNVGSNSPAYQTTGLQNNDTVKVVMTSSLGCVASPTVTSNSISMDVTAAVTPAVSIMATSTSICANTLVKFTATPVNGGDNPSYQWKLNGNNVGTNSSVYENSSLANGDVVTVIMNSSLPCASPNSASDTKSITVNQAITYYRDADGDGYGSANSGTIQSCGAINGYVLNNADCNDGDPNINPAVTEICGNGIDDDCDGQADENCTDSLPTLLVKTSPVKEGDAGYTIVNIDVKLDKPAAIPVSVHYATSNANAIAGSDYVAAEGTLTIPAGAVSGTVQLKVIGDLIRENNESFWLTFSDPVNVVLGADPRSRIMIIDDDKGKPGSAATSQETMAETSLFRIPTVVKRGSVWMIPQIANFENEVVIFNVQGQVVNRFVNYKNQSSIGNVATGLYFYQLRIRENGGQYKYYSGRLLITE